LNKFGRLSVLIRSTPRIVSEAVLSISSLNDQNSSIEMSSKNIQSLLIKSRKDQPFHIYRLQIQSFRTYQKTKRNRWSFSYDGSTN
jgi:hypothetical protein